MKWDPNPARFAPTLVAQPLRLWNCNLDTLGLCLGKVWKPTRENPENQWRVNSLKRRPRRPRELKKLHDIHCVNPHLTSNLPGLVYLKLERFQNAIEVPWCSHGLYVFDDMPSSVSYCRRTLSSCLKWYLMLNDLNLRSTHRDCKHEYGLPWLMFYNF